MKDQEAAARALQRAQEKVARREKTLEDQALSKLLADVSGRQLLWWLLRIGKVSANPYSLDPYQTAFACGELNVGNQILARIVETEPAGYLQMMKDQEDARRERNTPDERAADRGAEGGEPSSNSAGAYDLE
jgi:hypothetical protein